MGAVRFAACLPKGLAAASGVVPLASECIVPAGDIRLSRLLIEER